MKKWFDNNIKWKNNMKECKVHTMYKNIEIPSQKYPLASKLTIFNVNNAKEITDTNILNIINEVDFHFSSCYTVTKELVNKLQENGYNAKSYVGYLFVNKNELPVHHCWCVLDKSVIDLSDCQYTLQQKIYEYFKENESLLNEVNYVDIYLKIQKEMVETMSNVERCYPIGIPCEDFLYVGSECEPDLGKKQYQDLIRRFPNHEIHRNVDKEGYNKLNRAQQEHGMVR